MTTRHTIGFLAGNLHLGIAPRLWSGMLNAVRKHNINLFCFPGGSVNPVGEFDPERSAIFDLVDVDRFDGLATSGATAPGGLDPEHTAAFLRQYDPLPVISLTRLPGNIPHVSVDNYQGMREVLLHLIQVHGFHRLAFVRGPENHYSAQERYRAYIETLEQFGFPFDARLVTPPLPWEAGAEAIHILLDERGLRPKSDLQAIVTVSDLAALSALKDLQMRGIHVPDDVALVGFNDSEEGRLTVPPLTSVALPLYKWGEHVVKTLVEHLDGQEIPPQVLLPTDVMVRQSCGCPNQAMQLAIAELSSPKDKVTWETLCALREQITSDMTHSLDYSTATPDLMRQLIDALIAELEQSTRQLVALNGGLFLPTLERILHSSAASGDEVLAWQNAISVLRQSLLPHLDYPNRLMAEDFFGQARVLIGEIARQAQAFQRLQAERESETLRELGQSLITTFDIDRLADVLNEKLPTIGITSCYLALYEKPLREFSRMMLAFTEQGRTNLGKEGRRYHSRELVPSDLLPHDRQYSFVVEPLFFKHDPIGFVVFEVGPHRGTVYEILRVQISSALKGALLLRQVQEARVAAEKADKIKTRLLANVSHELRTPLNIILGYTNDALKSSNPYGISPPQALLNDLEHIRRSAEHQLRVVNDLLDLSRAEIDELDLYPELIDPRRLLEDAFHSIAHQALGREIAWQIQLPERLPLIQADPVRLRQILLNLLSNAEKFTARGTVVLGARIEPPNLHLWVQDTGIGIPSDMQEQIFEPFVTIEQARQKSQGVGLGLSITRRLVALHNGSMNLESEPGRGSTFHVYVPLPSLADKTLPTTYLTQPVLLLISASDPPMPEIVELSQRQGLTIRRISAGDNVTDTLAHVQPSVLAWDIANAHAGDWAIIRRLRNDPRLSEMPFILYGHSENEPAKPTMGLTGVVLKTASGKTLLDAINTLCPKEATGPILIVDDDPAACQAHHNMVSQGLSGYPIRVANDGPAALSAMAEEIPSLVLLDLRMPGMNGFDVLDRMRGDPRTRQAPVLVLTAQVLNLDDVKRIERHANVVLQSKDILSDAEIIAALHRSLFGADTLPPQTSALVKRAVAYVHQNYPRPLTRWEIAEAVGASENYLTHVFNQELGLKPWDYLNRFRISRAKELFRHTNDSVKSVAGQVGFKDQKYFSRVFHKLVGISPNDFREHPN